MIGYSKLDQVGKAKEKSVPARIKPGKKVAEWDKVREQLKRMFSLWGITSCELGLSGCKKSNMLSFAHVDKRKNLLPGEIDKVVLACLACHIEVEKLPSKQMREKLEKVIQNRITI